MKKPSPRVVSRNVFVCARERCSRCKWAAETVPKRCPCLILHALDCRRFGFRDMPRQSGKTRQLVRMANELAGVGNRVCIVAMNKGMCDVIRSRYEMNRSVLLVSEHESPARFMGLPEGYVLFDEVLPGKVQELMRMMPRSKMVAAYYTSR